MSQGPDITGTEGERLDVTVTVDSTFSSQETQTIELRVEDFNSGTTVHTDSQQVTLQDSTDSQQVTLSWPTSSGDKGVYDLFLESDQDTIQRLVEVTRQTATGPQIDDFESYSIGPVPLAYNAVNTNSNAGVVTTDANSGSQSLNIQGPTSSGFDPTITKTFSATTPDTIQVTYYETSSASGGAIRWLDSSGEELCEVASDNPGVWVTHGGFKNFNVKNSPSPSYGAWRRFTITPDFPNGTFDVLWEDIDGSSSNVSATGLSFVGNPSDVAEIQFGGSDRGDAPPRGSGGISGTFLIDDSSSL